MAPLYNRLVYGKPLNSRLQDMASRNESYCSRAWCKEPFSVIHERKSGRGHLRSAARGDLAVPHFRTTRYGQRCFAVSGPTLWNSLPLSVRDPSLTLTQFCARLKTVLFGRAYETLAKRLLDSLGCKDCCANIHLLAYLHGQTS